MVIYFEYTQESLPKNQLGFTLMPLNFNFVINFYFTATFYFYIGSRNIFTDVNFTILYKGDTLQIMCAFLNTTRINSERSCTVMFGNDLSSCRNLSQSLRSEQSTASVSRISVELPIVLVKQNILCLIVRASDGVHTVETERRITAISGILR